jgi:imidazolonepropionase-like amidohydrolase
MPFPGASRPGRGVPSAKSAILCFLLLMVPLLDRTALANTPRVHAIVGARIVTAPGKVIPRGTIVIRDGVITAVGAKVDVPADARVWEGDSLTVYAGLIDPFVMPAEPPAAAASARAPGGRPPVETTSPPRGPTHALPSVHPETRVADALPLSNDQLESLRASGFTTAQIVPRKGIVRGRSAVIGLGDGSANRRVLRADAAQVVALEADRNRYPGSLMGAIAVIRQAFLDARWYRDAQSLYDKSPVGKERPESNLSWEALEPAVAGSQPVLFVADDMLEVMRAGTMAKEAGVRAQILGAGDEYKRVKDIAGGGYPLIVPVSFPDAPDVANPDDALEVSTEDLRHWNQAPGNAAALAKAGATFSLTTNGLKDVKTFRSNVVRAIGRGLDADAALAAVTTTPAQMLGLADRLGTLAPGKIANLTVTRGDLFSRQGKVREVWVDGERYELGGENTFGGNWSIGWGQGSHRLIVNADKDTTVRILVGRDTLNATGVRLEPASLSFTFTPAQQPSETFYVTVKNEWMKGTLTAGSGSHEVTGWRVMESKPDGPDDVVPTPIVMGNTEAFRAAPPPQPAAVVVRNATIWTAGPQGTLEQTDLLVKAGKIAAVGNNLTAPSGATVIDAAGKHVAPGIIDCHSHSAILGNVNECTNSVTAEVRIRDVINSESIEIYGQIANGATMMHLLHGSCNAIGGQCAVIKNKWGEPPDHLLFAAAPQTIKFALGENPKQSNWGADATGRYPQTRAGVEETIRNAFTDALDYRAAWSEWTKHTRPLPPRRDLQKEAVLEILEGKRFIHSHSYRQDEILMLMRLAEQFGIKVQTFQHVLEGYKVADEMAKHGASASTFSDWWAYKYEVIDAIPYNGYLMWDRGVTVTFNSDDNEQARRLNTEAAKAIKYGGVPPEEAIKFVTLNAAKQLRIADRVGSIEVGKDADFAIWNGSPLSPYSHCEQTWIEGRKYFDREQDLAGRAALAKERETLLSRARASKKEGVGPLAARFSPRYLEDSDRSGSECGSDEGVFMSESERRALRNGEVNR